MAEYTSPEVGRPAVRIGDITHVPLTGTGLSGEGYLIPSGVGSVTSLKAAIFDMGSPSYRFTASEIAYGGREDDTTVAEFLGHDSDSLSGSDGRDFGPGGVTLKGYVFIPKGTHTINVHSDDGYELRIGGELFSKHEYGRGPGDTYAKKYFAGGLYEIELLYFDAQGGSTLRLEIDGFVVDDSAFYKRVADFTNPDPSIETVKVGSYHPSKTHGEEGVNDRETLTGNGNRNVIDGQGGKDTISGRGGDDELYGGYGNDKLLGGGGEDLLDGGRGSDLLNGGAGNDLLVSRSDAGEQRIGQLAIGDPTRPDPDREVNYGRQKLKGWEKQALVADDVLIGGEGRDTFLFSPLINAKLEIIEKHTRQDGTINWAGVAGENDEVHDHWVDSFGIDIIADYNAEEDSIAVIGHTANVYLNYRDTDGDGDRESVITVISKQHGNGGAHDEDLIGQIIVHGDKVEKEDIATDAGVTFGIVDDYRNAYEAIEPEGRTKKSFKNGETYFGYDTRDAKGGLGPVTRTPEKYVDNPYLDEVKFAKPTKGGFEATRGHFDQLGQVSAPGQTINGNTGDNNISAAATSQSGIPGALGFWRFDGPSAGAYADARGGPELRAYTLWESQAQLRTDDLVTGPYGQSKTALRFNGEDEFAFIRNDSKYQVSQGTIALWVRPQDLREKSVFLAKDESGTGDGGHFHIGHTDSGKLFMRFAPGDGGTNTTWEAKGNHLQKGDWAHIAVNFSEDGISVFVNGSKIANSDWKAIEGSLSHPGLQKKAYMIQNEQPWVIGANSSGSEFNATAQMFATDDDRLDDAFQGAIADIGFWGGDSKDDVLSAWAIRKLMNDGPGTALTRDSGPQPIIAADDDISGGDGNDTMYGGGGDDVMRGQNGRDKMEGGYGDDRLYGGAYADRMDGGFGSDLLDGGAGNDLLISRSDVGEDRAGQLVLGEPSRDFPDPSISKKYLKLADWTDQALIGDDVLIGGAGKDHFYFELGINAKLDIIQRHVENDRSIDWGGVAGENRRIHDHWVDGIGIDVIGDYEAGKDKISVIGHTTRVSLSYHGIDRDGDGLEDDAVSVITAYSQQGSGGGAHDEDILGYIVVFGDMVGEDDIVTDPGVMYGVVDTIDQLQTALAPEGETRSVKWGKHTLFGYDSRDVKGDPIGSRPIDFVLNDYIDGVRDSFDRLMDTGLRDAKVILTERGGVFNGRNDKIELPHTADQAQKTGSWAFSFKAHKPGEGEQALLSKDHDGYKGGGHLTIYIDDYGYLRARFQSFNESRYLKFDEKIEAGQDYHVTFTFSGGKVNLFVNGALADSEDGFPDGMIGNLEDMVIGASTREREGNRDNLEHFFDGVIENVVMFDRPLHPAEAIILAGNGGEVRSLAASADLLADLGTKGDDTIVGSRWEDDIYGSGGRDDLSGEGGDDMLYGQGGADILRGGKGNDVLEGGLGADILGGGANADAFVFRKVKEAGDEIRDFGWGNDILLFSRKAFGLKSDLSKSVAWGSAKDADDKLIYKKATGELIYDRDGDGTDHSGRVIVTLDPGTSLTLADFGLL